MKQLLWFIFGALVLGFSACQSESKAPPAVDAEPEETPAAIEEPVPNDSVAVHFDTLAEAIAYEDPWKLAYLAPEELPAPAINSDPADSEPIELIKQPVSLIEGDTFSLQVAKGFQLSVAAKGMRRVRFLTASPDGRIFATGMHTQADNNRGKVYILSDFDRETKVFRSTNVWLDRLRNPNALTFYTDLQGNTWLYLALTECLLRYPFQDGELTPSGDPDTVATFPAYGLSYKYGGWHLTRTPVFHNDLLYVSVGSSCNVCEEKENIRATVLQMKPDGSEAIIYASGLRNAVWLDWIGDRLFASNMGPDHLGDNVPDDMIYALEQGRFYGWPYCYEEAGTIKVDNSKEWTQKLPNGSNIPKGYLAFEAHASPLGFAYFNRKGEHPSLKNHFLVALHGSGKVRLGAGYSIVRSRVGQRPEPFISGFLQEGDRFGRPCGILPFGEDAFFFTDDHKGIVYYVYPENSSI